MVDQAPPCFELMVLKFNKKAEDPVYTSKAKTGKTDYKDDICFSLDKNTLFLKKPQACEMAHVWKSWVN